MGIAAVLILGIVFGLLCRRFHRSAGLTIILGSVLATFTWVGFAYLLLAVTAPNELGTPLPWQLFLTFVAAFAGACLAAIGRLAVAQVNAA